MAGLAGYTFTCECSLVSMADHPTAGSYISLNNSIITYPTLLSCLLHIRHAFTRTHTPPHTHAITHMEKIKENVEVTCYTHLAPPLFFFFL